YGLTLQQLQNALAGSNSNVGGDYLTQGRGNLVVRSLGILGGGGDPMERAFGMKSPEEAAAFLRAEDARRLQEIRGIVLTSVNNKPITVDDVVVGGPLPFRGAPSTQGVVVGHQTRLGKISLSRPAADGLSVHQEDDVVQGIVLLRKGHESLPAIVKTK